MIRRYKIYGKRKVETVNTQERLNQILQMQGWSRYRLSKESGLSESTITNIFTRGNIPTISTLEIICKSMNITLSQFFAEGDMIELSPELSKFIQEWLYLNPKQKEAALYFMMAMQNKFE